MSFVAEGRSLISGEIPFLLYGERAAAFQKWSTTLLSYLKQRWPVEGDFYRDAAHLARKARRAGGVHPQDVAMLLAHLEAAGEIENHRAQKPNDWERIPAPVIAVLSEVLPEAETHASLNALFLHADAPGDPPDENKQMKVQEWLRRINSKSSDPFAALGRIVEPHLEIADDDPFAVSRKERIELALEANGLRYLAGGTMARGGALPSQGLQEVLRARDLPAVEVEFERALRNVERSPREAVSAACNILESACKYFIQDNSLAMPRKQDLRSVWNVVRRELGLDSGALEDDDLKKIVSGMLSAVDGISSLRTHASTAHGHGRRPYRLEARHARLAVNSAHTVTMFLLEAWENLERAAQQPIAADRRLGRQQPG